ncbi:MAG: hypothetical protein GC138_03930 [Gammaproteobacteria bacterium]|nr:hypothetical protein [Gammaproteobacteria bacterium]
MSRIHAFAVCLLAPLLGLAVSPIASASMIGLPAFELTLSDSGFSTDTLIGSDLGLSATGEGMYTSTGTYTSVSGDNEYSWDLLIDPDPTIGGTFGITNLLGTAKVYNLAFTLPVGTAFSQAMVNGHFSGSVMDNDASGSAALDDITWSGLIDGITVMNSGPAGIGCHTAGCSTAQPITYLGPMTYLPGVSSNIATNISFTLSAGDRVTFRTYFDVSPIPEPGTLALFAGLAVSWQTARKKGLIRSVD